MSINRVARDPARKTMSDIGCRLWRRYGHAWNVMLAVASFVVT